MTPLVMWNLVIYAKFTKVRVHNNKKVYFSFSMSHALFYLLLFSFRLS